MILIIGVVCAVLAFGGVFYLLQNGSGGGGPTVQVLETATSLTPGTTLTQQNVKIASLPSNAAPVGAYQAFGQVSGKVTTAQLPPNTPLIAALVTVPGSGGSIGGGPTSSNGLQITPGMVAMAIPTATSTSAGSSSPINLTGTGGDLMSVGYYIQPNDHIDILIFNGRGIRYSFQDVRVLKVGDSGSDTSKAAPAAYIVEMSRPEAEQLATLFTVTNNTNCLPTATPPCTPANPPYPVAVKYVLRNPCDYGDPNYATDIKGKSASLVKQECINPYPNYLPSTAASPDLTAPPGVADTAVTNGTLGSLFP